jgi:predicted enzyme related to lactoylglutathione lyase
MTDVRDAPAPSVGNDNGPNPAGSFIWYELMTPDPAGAKAFYDSVVGWNIAAESQFPNGYRMIGRSDGKSAGGLLPLTDEMQQHGARPTWLSYISVDDVDRTVSAIEEAGGKTYMPAFDIPDVGRVAMVADPQGAPFYVMKPTPPANDPHGRSDVFSVDERSMSAGTSFRLPILKPRSTFTGVSSDGARKATWIWARWASTASSSRAAPLSAR